MPTKKQISEVMSTLSVLRWNKTTPEERKAIMAKVTKARISKRLGITSSNVPNV